MGIRYGGRKRGTPNKRSADIEQRLRALGCDPLEGMAQIALDESNPVELRARMFAELAPYVAPKRKAVDMNLEGGPAITILLQDSFGEPRPIEPAANVVPLLPSRP